MTQRRSGWATRKPTNAAAAARIRKYRSPEHRAARKAIQAQLDAGHPVTCWRCGHGIPNIPAAWHVGHDDHDPNIIRGAEHATCNVRAAARKGARIANTRAAARTPPRYIRRAASRVW